MTREDLKSAGVKLTQEVAQYLRPTVVVKLSDPKAMPLRAYPSDAGADLFSSEKAIIYPGGMQMIDTGVAIKIPVGYGGFVYSRSGQGKIRVALTNSVGVIDSQYRGNIKVILLNEGDDPYEINTYSTRIAQLVIAPVMLAQFRDFNEYPQDTWEDTDRGVAGFGSTG